MGNFKPVSLKADKIAIFGTGNSLDDLELMVPPNIFIIAVNSAIYYFDYADAWFTLDPSPSNVRIMAEKPINPARCAYFAAVPTEFRQNYPDIHYLQRVMGTGHGRYKTKAGLCGDKRGINTGNSAAGALQLAAHMKARKVALFGVDGYGSYHYGGEPRNLTMMPELFASYVPGLKKLGIQVINGSPQSSVDCFDRVTPQEALEWLAA